MFLLVGEIDELRLMEFDNNTYLYCPSNWDLNEGYEVKDFPMPILWANKAVGAAHIAATIRPSLSCCFNISPTKGDSAIALEPPKPPGKITTSYLLAFEASKDASGTITISLEHLTGSIPVKPATVTLICNLK